MTVENKIKKPPMPKTETMAKEKSKDSLLNFIKQKQEDHRFTKSLEIGFTFILISVLAIFAIRPAVITITQLTGEIKAKKLLHKELDKKLRKVIEAQNNFAEIQDYYTLIERSLPNSPQYSYASEQLFSLSNQSNLTIDKLNFAFKKIDPKDKTLKNMTDYNINSTIQTDFYPAVDFLNKISQSKRIIDITSVSMNIAKRQSSSDETSSNQVNFSFNTNVYYWKP